MDRNTSNCRLPRLARSAHLLAAAALCGSALFATALSPSLAWAGPRDDMKAAYQSALDQANNLEYDGALATLNAAISGAEGAGNGEDPVLASLYLLRAALTFSAEGHGAASKILSDLQRAVTLNYYVVVPMEMRSDDLANYMQQARQASGASAPQPITLRDPVASCGAPLHFEVLLSVPDGGSAALYWRKVGTESEFAGADMPAFSNVAEVDIPADEHGDADIEYFIYAFDASSNPVANLGQQEQPVVIEQACSVEAPVEDTKKPVTEEDKPAVALPRVWINLGLGTGLGIARGTASNTYRQFFPRGQQEYGPAESGCAIARWVAGTREVTAVPAAELLQAFDAFGAPGTTGAMMMAFNATECAERHPVSTGFASAPFHIAPEIAVRIGKRISLGLYGRFQVLTGAKLFRDDPGKPLQQSFDEDVTSDNPQGVKQKVAFNWGVGLKFKFFLGKDKWKLRPFVGAQGGFSHTALRVPMGFANDRNGNSVPDDAEIGFDTDINGNCYPVWPYNDSCSGANMTVDNNKAANVAMVNQGDERVDVVRIGPVYLGALVGFNYQIHKNFGLFGEVGIGGGFPKEGSLLIDIAVGPSITF